MKNIPDVFEFFLTGLYSYTILQLYCVASALMWCMKMGIFLYFTLFLSSAGLTSVQHKMEIIGLWFFELLIELWFLPTCHGMQCPSYWKKGYQKVLTLSLAESCIISLFSTQMNISKFSNTSLASTLLVNYN